MCIDYTDLNKHYPKDPFPIPRIDQIVDSTAGSVLLCFLDYYSRYHQIALNPDDEDKPAFITPHDIWPKKCWSDVPEGNTKVPEVADWKERRSLRR
jgi:hypothetical protein